MGKELVKLVKGEDLQSQPGGSSFAALLREEGDRIRRDVFMLMNPENSVSGRIQAGITVVYPCCSTKGHSHPDREEVYYFLRGRGVMGADSQEWEVKAGDTFYVNPGPYHTTRNPYDTPLEFFWITIKTE